MEIKITGFIKIHFITLLNVKLFINNDVYFLMYKHSNMHVIFELQYSILDYSLIYGIINMYSRILRIQD